MKLTSYARTRHELGVMKDLGFTEAILEPKAVSRFGKLSQRDFVSLAQEARTLGMRVLLEWDILMTEDVFQMKLPFVKELLPFADALRVQDPGALHWGLSQTSLPLQFIAENGNHNLKALEGWAELAQGRLERFVLSLELSKSSLAEYTRKLSVPCELLGLGRILLFYTPRPLLSALAPEKMAVNGEIAALGESEESPHKGFPIVENSHGTFMFHIKEFCLLDFAAELKELGLSYFRLDQRWHDQLLREAVSLAENFEPSAFETFKNSYSQDLMRGFYLVNKTDVLFPKLKNSRLQGRDETFAGEVLEAEKGEYLAVLVKNGKGLSVGQELRILHPKGQEFRVKVFKLRNAAMEEVDHIGAGKLALMQPVNGVWVKSQVFYA